MKKQWIALALVLSMTIVSMPQAKKRTYLKTVQASTLTNPKKDEDGTVTWDCVWFGSYPQSEVTNLTTDIISASYNSNGDAVVSGVKYRRIKESDATYSSTSSGYYDWSTGGDANGYHYFKYEPIKWRVLSVNGRDAFLLADVGLDDQRYNQEYVSITWENCTLRNFLNNQFLNSAFSSSQQNAIRNTNVENKDNPNYGTEGGNDTIDKVYLLSYDESINESYGFNKDRTEDDTARRAKTSAYVHAMGAWNSTSSSYQGNCWWWLRSPGYNASYAFYVDYDGYVFDFGDNVNYDLSAVRPALHLNLSSSNLYSYAGTVSSDGTMNEQDGTVTPPVEDDDQDNSGTSTPEQDTTKTLTDNNQNGQGTTQATTKNDITQPTVTQDNSNDKQNVNNQKVTSFKVKETKKKVKLSWKKNKKASGYQIQYSTNRKLKKAKQKYTTKTKLTIKKLQSKKKYYFRIRAYRTESGRKVYGAWSSIKSKKIK